MNINKKVITDLKKTNEKISEAYSSLSKYKEEELKNLSEEINKARFEKPKTVPKKKETILDFDKKITTNILNFSKLIPKETKKKSLLKELPMFRETPRKLSQKASTQSSENYVRQDNSGDIQEEKLKTLKSISSKLDLMKTGGSSGKDSGKSGSGIFDSIKNSLLGSLLGAGLTKGVGLVKKVGVGKTLGYAFALKSAYDLFGNLKDGYSDYKKFKAIGDNVKADQAIFKGFIGSSGNLIGMIAPFVPGPLQALLYPLGMFLDNTAKEFSSIASDKSNKTMQDIQAAAYAKDRLVQGEKFNILQLKPNIKNMTWSYKNYQNDSWEPLLTSDGNPLSMNANAPQITSDSSEKGINKYKLQSKEFGTVELVLIDGKPKMKCGDTISDITPRQSGGSVQKNKKYLVGEKGPELFQTNSIKSKSELNVFRNTFLEVNSSFKKLINNFSLDSLKDFFTPEVITYRMKTIGTSGILSGKELLDFSKIPTDSLLRFKDFQKQVYSFEGGFSDVSTDRGGRTNFGVTQNTYNAYRKMNKLAQADVKDITKDEADKVYYDIFYNPSNVSDIQDPKLAYAYYDSFVQFNPAVAKRFLRESGGDVNKFLDLREAQHRKQSESKNKKGVFDQRGNLDGWLKRVNSIRNMIQTSSKIVEITSNKDIKSLPLSSQPDVVDSDFLMKHVLPALANAVSSNYSE
jgi:hypothetical protein